MLRKKFGIRWCSATLYYYHHLVPSPNPYKCKRNSFALLDLLIMDLSMKSLSPPNSNSLPVTTSSKKRFRQTLAGNIYKDILPCPKDQELRRCAASLLHMSNHGEEPTLKRTNTVRKKKRGNREPYSLSGEYHPMSQDEEPIWKPSETIFSLEEPIGNCWSHTQTPWPSTRNLCNWCGQQNCALMCFQTYHFFNPVLDGSGVSASYWQQNPIQEQSSGDGSQSEMLESPTLRCTTSQQAPLSSPVESMPTFITPTPMKNMSSLIGVGAMKFPSRTDWWNNSRTDISCPRSTNPLPNDS